MECDSFDLLIKNVAVKDRHYQVFDIGIKNGLIAQIATEIETNAARILDGAGGLAAPSFVDSHSHLDKYRMIHMSSPAVTGTLAESFARAREGKLNSSVSDVVSRVTEGARIAISNGIGAIRVHSEVDETWGITGIEGLIEVRKIFSDYMDLQILAMPSQNPMTDNLRSLVRKAMDAGADAIGGSPHLEYTQPDVISYVDFVFDIAGEYNVPIDLHVDQNVDAVSYTRALEHILVKTLRLNYQSRVTVNHCGALAAYAPAYRVRVINLMKQAGVSFVMCPKEELIINGMGPAPVREIYEAGVNCCYAHNNCADTFSPYGRMDMLEAGMLAIHAGGISDIKFADNIIDMATTNPARVMGLEGYGVCEGSNAHLNIFTSTTAYDVYRQGKQPKFVIRGGRLIAENNTQGVMHF